MRRSSSGSTSERSRAARSSCGSATAPSSAPPSPTTRTPCSTARCPTVGRCRPSGRCRCPRTTSRCCAPPCPPPSSRRVSTRGDVIGIGTDFTACTMVPTTADGTPLCELPEFAGEPHAYVKLWRHHAAQPQADRINELARKRSEPWLPRYGGLISSEWEFAKGLQMLEEAPARLRRDAALGRGRRLDRLAAHRNLRPQRVHRGLQGHPAGRRVPGRGVPPRAQPRLRAVRRRQAGAAAGQARRPRGRSLRRGGRVDRAARRHRGRRRQRRRARHRARGEGRRARASSSRSWARPPAT